MGSLGDDRRTQTVTLAHLDQARRALVEAIADVPATPADWVSRLRQLAAAAGTLVDIAQTLTAERGDEDAPEVLVWARAVRATIASYERDVEVAIPWALDLEPLLTSPSPTTPEALQALRRLTASSLTLADLPHHAEAVTTTLPAEAGASQDPELTHRDTTSRA